VSRETPAGSPEVGHEEVREPVEAAWEGTLPLADPAVGRAVEAAIDLLDGGVLRVATPGAEGWTVHEWVKKAILLHFRLRPAETMEVGAFEYCDKVPLKRGYQALGVRVVPPAVARRGAHLCPGVVMMPSYVNIGAWVGSRTMVDTWATVGSCAQIGEDVHLSGGVGIGGVLEPLQAAPVIVEDGAFIGSRCIVVEGVVVERRAVLGAGVVLTASTPIVDVTGPEPVEYRRRVPAGAVVIPGSRPKRFPAGEYHVPAALIIGRRSATTDLKVSLNEALRQHGLSVGA
jgi:2,3,4,5-tetrahydropyridine-2,6-dicarboxylate N-succinyltransferase